ncbi:MAG: hypothetical protein CVV27_19200 [Candidatus Melainabacteria bacterium HGW-Melainabacteria-1]|nr:MAG: hypothetical protein CVV27_19200 [Candidatus Melainabacteria bacterium HGW-Melainabacteria-1]
MNWHLGLLWHEYRYVLTSRRSKLLLGMFLWGLVMMPLVLQKPPAEIVHFLAQWLGEVRAQDKLFLFAWCDLAMNKLAVISGLALGGGLLVSERASGLLPLLLSKPIGAGSLYLVKLLAAQGVYMSLYLLLSLLAGLIYPLFIQAFELRDFAVVVSVHMLAGTFAVAFAAWMAVLFRRRLSGMVASLFFLSLMIGTAFLGFYAPALSWLTVLNPFYHGVALIAELEALSPQTVLIRAGLLLGLNVAVLALGVHRARQLEAREVLL